MNISLNITVSLSSHDDAAQSSVNILRWDKSDISAYYSTSYMLLVQIDVP